MAFGQPKKEQPAAPAVNTKKLEPYDIHVMPQKFHQYTALKSKGSTSKLLLIIAISFFVLTMLGIGGYFIYLQMNLPNENINANANDNVNMANENINANENDNTNMVNENLNENENINVNENENINENENLNTNANDNANLNGNINENSNVNANTNVNSNLNINAPVGMINYTGSLDTDSDKLTDAEEDLYQTEKRKPDTDEDGYLDGDEIVNGYSPKAAGGAKLETSGLVNKYTNPVFHYDILYPTSWLARPEDQSLKVVLFMTSTEEFFRVGIEDNIDKLDLVSWYLILSPGADLNLLEKISTSNGYEALVSPDKLSYYILDPNTQDKVYVINYNIGSLSQINFLSTFSMMVNRFNVSLPAE